MIMFVLMILGSILSLAALVAIVRRCGETKTNCGPMHRCLGGGEKRQK